MNTPAHNWNRPRSYFPMLAAFVCPVLPAIGALYAISWRHRFTPAGVQVPMLGLRLRSIPAKHISNYFADCWKFQRGDGIRGMDERRAYVGGNRGVRITTATAEVFLGHDHPERTARDLDLVADSQPSRAGRGDRG
jgi:hypothetical protein